MDTLLDLLPRIGGLGAKEAIRFWNGYRTWRWSYADLDKGIRRFVAHLDRSGLARGDRLVLWSDNRPEWVAVFWACLARGVQVVPIDHHSSREFVTRIIVQTKAKLLVHYAAADCPDSAPTRLAIESLHELPSGPRFVPNPARAEDVVQILYTSGTTARPKGVIHRHRNICANLDPIRQEIDRYKKWARPFQPIRILNLVPLSHMFGQSMGIFVPLLLDASAVFMSGLHPAAIRNTIRRERISVLVCVPRMLESLRSDIERRHPRTKTAPRRAGGPIRRWWRHRDVHRAFGLKFWAFVVGGAMLNPETESFWSRIGLLVIQGYGLAETSPVVAVNHPFRARRGTLGEVIGGQQVRLADDGEILVKGESVVAEYLGAGTSIARAVDEDGWLHTGDIGDFDSDGRLRYRGRKKDVIVTSDGLNVFPADIERALKRDSAVRDAVVVPVGPPDRESIHAALILDAPSEDPITVVERVNRILEPHQRIQSSSEWPEEEFPRTPSTFKTQRRKVAARLSATNSTPEHSVTTGLDQILQALTRRAQGDLTDDRRLDEDLGLSSLERVDMLASLEDHYGIELDETDFAALSTVGQVRTWVEGRADSRLPHLLDDSPIGHAQRKGSGTARVPAPRWALKPPAALLRTAVRRALVLPLFRHYIPLSVGGLQHLEQLAPPLIFAANHASHLDTVALIAALPARWHRWLAPAVRQQYFFPSGAPAAVGRRAWMRTLYFLSCGLFNAYPLTQSVGQVRDALRYTGELVGAGYCPLVYPEGKRTRDGRLLPFRPGVGLMALRLEVPVVPVYLHGLLEIMSATDSWPHRGSVHIEFGSPVRAGQGEEYAQLAQRIKASVQSMAVGFQQQS